MSEAKPPSPDSSALASRFPTRIHRLNVAGRTIDLLAPVDPDALLDDPIVEERYKADNYLPYWPIIWPSGLMMGAEILKGEGTEATRHQGTEGQEGVSAGPVVPSPPSRAIELGCGLGSTGIAAGLRGWDVTFTDYDPEAVQFAAHNALRNGLPPERVRGVHMDWRDPVKETFPWVLASDVLYERRLHPLLLECIQKVLAQTAEAQAWVSDPMRSSAEDFPIHAVEHGFKVQTFNLEGENFAGEKQLGHLYVLRWAKV